MISLTVNEVRRLINTVIIRPIRDLTHRLHWSHWRRRHQARARRSQYKRRPKPELQPRSRMAAAVLAPNKGSGGAITRRRNPFSF
jgi:hypothetical protein